MTTLHESLDELARLKAERKWVGKKVYITKGYYQGHFGVVASVEDTNSFIVRGGTLNTLEPLICRDELRLARNTDLTTNN